MPVFTSCTTRSVTTPYGTVVINNPVNLTLVKAVQESTYYKIPSIYFHFGENDYMAWCFNTTEERDAEFERIITL